MGQLGYGPVSDRYGRKPSLYFGLVLYVLASLACMRAVSLNQLAFFRFFQGLGGCAGMIIPRAMVRDRLCAGAGPLHSTQLNALWLRRFSPYGLLRCGIILAGVTLTVALLLEWKGPSRVQVALITF